MSEPIIERDSNGDKWVDGVQVLRGGLPEDDPGLAALRSVNSELPAHWWSAAEERPAVDDRDLTQS